VLLESGVLLNLCVVALLLRPVPAKSNLRSDVLYREVRQTILQCFRGFKCVNTVVFAMGDAVLIVGELNFFMTIPFAMTFWGYQLQDSAYALMYAAISSLLARLGCSVLSDKSWFHVRTVYIIGTFAAGGCCLGKE